MSGVRKEEGVAPHRERQENPAVPAVGGPARFPARPHIGDARVNNGTSMADSRTSHLVSGRPSLPTVRIDANGLPRPSIGNASMTPIQAPKAPSIPGSTEQSPSSRADGRSTSDFVPNDAFIGRLQASKAKMSARPKSAMYHKPDATGSNGNPASSRASMGGARTDRASPSSAGNVDSGLPAVAERHRASPMEVDRTAHPLANVLTTSVPNKPSSATRSIIPQNRKEPSRPSIAASGSPRFTVKGTFNVAPTPAVIQHVPAAQEPNPIPIETHRAANQPHPPVTKPAESRNAGYASPPPRVSRSPSLEMLDQETFHRTTPSKKRKLSTFPASDVATSTRPSVLAQALAVNDLLGQEVELLNGIESRAEAVPLDLLESLLEDEDMTSTAQEDNNASNGKPVPATTNAVNRSSDNSVDSTSRLAEWKAPQAPNRTNADGRDEGRFVSLVDTVNKAADAASASVASQSTAISTAVPYPETASTTSTARDDKLPRSSVSVINLNLSVPLSVNASGSSNSSGKVNGKPTVFKVPLPVGTSLKGKEPVRPQVPFERQASPPMPVVTMADRQELWKKQAMAVNGGTLPKDVDCLLHSNQRNDDPFWVSKQEENAEAGPSFKHAPVPESAYIHMLPEPRSSEGMTQDFDYRKFHEPLLDCINSLPDYAQNPSHIRVILEAYYSQSTLDHAPAIKIDGGEYDEYPPPEFKYSDEVYYSEKVPKPWLGKGCECIGPCSENSDCFCLKRQEMYFASYITDPIAGPLKGFAHNDDGTLKDCQYPTWECGPQCDCPPACKNRVMQKGRSPKVQLEIYKTRKKGWGVRALSSFPKGTFVGLYSGEVIPEEETDARGEIYNAIERTYLFDLDHWHIKQPPENLASIDPAGAYIAQQAAAILQEEDEKVDDEDDNKGTMFNSFFTVDAFHWGFTRFFNHSCDPNLVLSAAYFDDFDVRKPRLAITAKKDIRKGDELCISYLGPPDDDDLPPMVETDEQLRARTGTKDNGKRGVVRKRKGGTAHKQKASQTKTPEKLEVGRCHCGAKNCMGYMFNVYSKG